MASIRVPGLSSGLDVNGIITQLIQAQSTPLARLDRKEASFQAKLSAIGSVKGALASLQASAAGLAAPERFRGVSAALGDAALASVSATSAARPGLYTIEVQALAQAQKLKSTGFGSLSESVGSGEISIQHGSYGPGGFTPNPDSQGVTIAIPAGADSLAAVRDAINAAGAGVSASVVNDGSAQRLVISSTGTGLANALRITVNDDDGNDTDAAGLSRLAYDASAGGPVNLTQAVAAADAALTLDGIAIGSASNTIAGAIEGLTLQLAKTGGPTTLRLARDTAGMQAAVQSFVTAWNSANKTLRDLSAYDAAAGKGAVLQGDATLLSVQSQLRALLNRAIEPASGGLSRLSDAGITFQQDGTLGLDSAKLSALLADPSKDVATLFAAVGKPSDSLVEFSSATSTAAAGTHALGVTRLATRGSASGSVAAGLAIASGVNDSLTLSVDGASATVTLSPGAYSAASLAAELQARINSASAIAAAGSSVAVTESAGVLTVTSQRYGSASTVLIEGGNGAAGLFGAPATSDGVDAAGTIGGVSASGSGQSLSASGFTLRIAGGSTGNRGDLVFSRGYAAQLAALLDPMLALEGGLAARSDGLAQSIKDIDRQRAAINHRLADEETRLRAQFAALDKLLASMNSTSSFLASQLASLPGSYNPN